MFHSGLLLFWYVWYLFAVVISNNVRTYQELFLVLTSVIR